MLAVERQSTFSIIFLLHVTRKWVENGALSYYRDVIQNLERESSHVEVPGAASNADRA